MFDFCLLEDLLCEDGGEAGSFETLWVIPAWAIISTPSPSRLPTSEPIQIVAGSTSTVYKFQIGTLGYREESQGGQAGTYNTIVIEGFRNKITSSHLHEIRKLAPGHYVVIHQDANGLVRIHGSKDKPLLFSWISDTGKSSSDRAGIDWKFSGVSGLASPVMDASIPPPNQLLLPEARLNIFSLAGCIQVFSIGGSRESDGTPLDSQSTSVKLEYSFFSGPNLLYSGLITPNQPAATLSNWQITEGIRTSTDFENEVVNNITTGAGASMRWDMNPISATLPQPGTIKVQLRIKEASLFSPISEQELTLCETLIGIHSDLHDNTHN